MDKRRVETPLENIQKEIILTLKGTRSSTGRFISGLDPAGFYPGPIFEKIEDPDPTCEKKKILDPDPTLNNTRIRCFFLIKSPSPFSSDMMFNKLSVQEVVAHFT